MILTDLVIVLCLALSAFFSGMEIAFISSNRIFLEIEKQQEGLTSKVLKIITENPSRFIATMLVGNNISLVIYGIFMGERIIQLLFPNSDGGLLVVFYQTLISTGIILLTAEFLPKVFFQIYANTFIKIFAIPVAFFFYFFMPVTHLVIQLTDGILKRFFKTESDKAEFTFSKIELGNYIEDQLESTQNKENIDSEIQIFQKALDFSQVKVKEAMVPRAEVVAVENETALEEAKALFIDTGLSKIPVYQNSMDEIIGYVHAFDMFRKPRDLKSILIPVSFVPETIRINEVLKMLTLQRRSIAVVLDEYGGTSGIVTVEDIVEELFGEIEDEYDNVAYFEKKISNNEFEFSARLEIDTVNQNYNLEIPESEFYETLGGFIAFHTGEIPQKDENVTIENFDITIKEVTATKIQRIVLRVKDKD